MRSEAMGNNSYLGHLAEKNEAGYDLERHPGMTTDPRGNRAYSTDVNSDRKIVFSAVAVVLVVLAVLAACKVLS
jgi:hypothetical protein